MCQAEARAEPWPSDRLRLGTSNGLAAVPGRVNSRRSAQSLGPSGASPYRASAPPITNHQSLLTFPSQPHKSLVHSYQFLAAKNPDNSSGREERTEWNPHR
jgi:hypothetical protein